MTDTTPETATVEVTQAVEKAAHHRTRKGGAAVPIAYMRKWAFEGDEGTRGNRPHGWHLHAVTKGKVLSDDIPLYAHPPAIRQDGLREALKWYGEQARLARLIHSGGDAGRHALADDGGKRALAALSDSSTREENGAALDQLQHLGQAYDAGDALRETFLPMDQWDARDETVLLLVDYTDGDHPLDDAIFAITIGHNNDHNIDETDGWKFAGWCWSHDHYVEGKGKPVGWMPLPHHLAAALSASPEGEG